MKKKAATPKEVDHKTELLKALTTCAKTLNKILLRVDEKMARDKEIRDD